MKSSKNNEKKLRERTAAKDEAPASPVMPAENLRQDDDRPEIRTNDVETKGEYERVHDTGEESQQLRDISEDSSADEEPGEGRNKKSERSGKRNEG